MTRERKLQAKKKFKKIMFLGLHVKREKAIGFRHMKKCTGLGV